MGGTLSETRMKKSILEESRKNVEDKIDLRMPKTANNMPWSATGNCTDHAELMGEHKICWIHERKLRQIPPNWIFPKCGLLVAYEGYSVRAVCHEHFKPMEINF